MSCYRLLVTNVCVDKENKENGCILMAIKVARRNIECRQGDNHCLTFFFPFLSVWKEKKTAIKQSLLFHTMRRGNNARHLRRNASEVELA